MKRMLRRTLSHGIRPRKRRWILADKVLTPVAVFAAFVTLMSAYGGMVNPAVLPAGALLAMIFSPMIVVDAVLAVILFFFNRRLVAVIGLSVLASVPTILRYAPVNPHHTLSPEEEKRSFTLLTYNTFFYIDYEQKGDRSPNPTVQLLIDSDADIICLQEALFAIPYDNLHVSDEMVNTLKRRYPYRINESSLTLYSKFPVTRVLNFDVITPTALFISYRLNIRGRLVDLYNVHLQSIGLSSEDKELYQSITEGSTSTDEIGKVRQQLFSKLYTAFQLRSEQAQYLRQQIEQRHGNVILCGDFNDVPGCYALRTLMGAGMHDAFADGGFGPSVTYRAGRFYFRIDHILYRGDMRAVNTERLNGGQSDHYPVMTTFIWDEPTSVENSDDDHTD